MFRYTRKLDEIPPLTATGPQVGSACSGTDPDVKACLVGDLADFRTSAPGFGHRSGERRRFTLITHRVNLVISDQSGRIDLSRDFKYLNGFARFSRFLKIGAEKRR